MSLNLVHAHLYRYLLENQEWLQEALGEEEDDYILFDCPGQIELYTHMTVMKRLISFLHDWNFRFGFQSFTMYQVSLKI